MTDKFKNPCNYVVVRNAAHSDSFAIFESSEVRALLADKLGGREITMTRMQDWLVEALKGGDDRFATSPTTTERRLRKLVA